MYLIGLTGPSGSGKGCFSCILAEHGIPCIDADKVYHELLVPPSPCLDALTEAFGKEILNVDGTLARKTLASIVFSPEDEAVRAERIDRLNKITHRFVMDETKRRLSALEADGYAAAVFDAPALYEAGADKLCALIVTVLAGKETRISRIMARDGLTKAQAEMRISAQHTDDFYAQNAHVVLYNDGSDAAFRVTVEAFLMERLSQFIR